MGQVIVGHLKDTWPVIPGLVATAVLNLCIVSFVVECIRDWFRPLPPPSADLEVKLAWARLTAKGRRTSGDAIGLIEGLVFFVAIWHPNAWPLLPSWFGLKVALYWQGANFAAAPDRISHPITVADIEYFHARRQLGTYHIAVLLGGTGANILAAVLGVWFGQLFVPKAGYLG